MVRCMRAYDGKLQVYKPDSLRGHEAQIRSGLKDGHEVENWEPRLQLIDQALYQKFFPKDGD